MGSGQVLTCPYDYEKAALVVREMADMLALDLVDKGMVADQVVLTVGYDIENLTDPERKKAYKGEVTVDRYGRRIPKHAHGSIHLERQTSSGRIITEAAMRLYRQIVDEKLLIRRLNLVAAHVVPISRMKEPEPFEQMDLFTDYAARDAEREREQTELLRENKMQQAMLDIKKKFGKNAILKGFNLEEGATARDRNGQIGGHRA